MKNNSNNFGLIGAIIFASIIIAGSLVFFGLQMKPAMNPTTSESPTNLDEAIAKGIENFVQNQEKNLKAAEKSAQNAKKKNLVKPNVTDHVRGNKTAPITIIEYSDYECPFCKRFHGTMKKVLASYGDQINWIYRNFPLDFHDPLATEEAEATECVADLGGNTKYWEFSDLIFTTTKSNKGLDIEKLPSMAESIGIDKIAFNECMASDKFLPKIQQSIQEGSRAGVRGTPGSFILNNKTGKTEFVPGALPFERLKPLIDSVLK